VATAVDEDFTLGLFLRNKLGGNHVAAEEEDDIGNDDAKVAPE
jgi:hypothetical protein